MNKVKSMRLTKPIVLVALFLMLVLAFTLCSIQVNDFAEQIFEVAGIDNIENKQEEMAEARSGSPAGDIKYGYDSPGAISLQAFNTNYYFPGQSDGDYWTRDNGSSNGNNEKERGYFRYQISLVVFLHTAHIVAL